MPSHDDHPPIRENGLADGCARCAEMAADPLGTLDHVNLPALIMRTLDDRFGYSGGDMHARSDAEARAMANIMTMLEQTGRLLSAAPGQVVAYAVDRWKIPMEVLA